MKGETCVYEPDASGEWKVVDDHQLEKTFFFDDYKGPWAFVNRLVELAEKEQHHPRICFSWGEVLVKLWTHEADGITEKDREMAVKIDAVPR
jgi:4a-hydroxytetrahydrobiopterin dehydratase